MELAGFIDYLGKPVYQDEEVLLYQGDCSGFLAKLPSGQIPLTVTSPPYNIGKEYESILKTQDYLVWCQSWIEKQLPMMELFG